MSFIQARNVWQRYGDHIVLEGLNLSVDEGEFCTLVGASGCGKSTFLRLLLGQERPSRGQLLLDGRHESVDPAHEGADEGGAGLGGQQGLAGRKDQGHVGLDPFGGKGADGF